MAQLNLRSVDAFRVTFQPFAGGRNKRIIVQGVIPPLGAECTLKGERYRIVKIKPERVIAVIKMAAKP